jgi:hypothetical protein
MAVLSQNFVKSGHWYAADGTPMHRLLKADGSGERMTTIKDARRMGLYPSVTSILKIMAKPALDKWKQNQVALATLRCPRQESESLDYWCARVCDAAFEQVEDAATLGGRIHEALEQGMIGELYDPELAVYVDPVIQWASDTGILVVEREVRLVNKAEGFAGASDFMLRYGQNGIGILDYKTKKTKPGEPVLAYEDQAMQLAAYAATYWGEEELDRVLAANVFISTTEPGRFEVVKHANLRTHWNAFRHCAELWRYLNKYDPREVVPA